MYAFYLNKKGQATFLSSTLEWNNFYLFLSSTLTVCKTFLFLYVSTISYTEFESLLRWVHFTWYYWSAYVETSMLYGYFETTE